MTKPTSKADQLQAKIAKSEVGLRSSEGVSANVTDASPPEKLSGLLGEYPALAVAAGLGLGLLAGALLPRSAGRKLARGGIFVASTAGELGLALGKQALRRADEVTRDGRDKLEESANEARQIAADAGRFAADAGRKAGDEAQRLALDASGKARELGVGILKLAGDVAARIRQ